MYGLRKTPEFEDWYDEQPLKARFQIDERLSHIVHDGHFGTHKDLTDEVWELKWKNGRRLYFGYIPERKVLLLLGGNKNGQDKDIQKAKGLYKKYTA